MANLETEHSEDFAYPAAAVFAVLADLEGRRAWQPDIIEIRVQPAGPAKMGSEVFESRKIKGHETKGTLIVTVLDQGRDLTLKTPDDAKQPSVESYRIEPLSGGTCRLHGRIELGGIPKIASVFVRKALTSVLPENFERLRSVIAANSGR